MNEAFKWKQSGDEKRNNEQAAARELVAELLAGLKASTTLEIDRLERACKLLTCGVPECQRDDCLARFILIKTLRPALSKLANDAVHRDNWSQNRDADQPLATNVGLAERTREYIDLNFGRSCSLEEIASSLGASVRSLTGCFRTTYAVSVHEYLTAVRLKEAVKRLSETDDKVATVALGAGFGSVSSLYRSLRKFAEVECGLGQLEVGTRHKQRTLRLSRLERLLESMRPRATRVSARRD